MLINKALHIIKVKFQAISPFLLSLRDPFRMDLPAEFGIFLNWGGRGGLVDLDSKFSAAEEKKPN